MLYAKVWKFDLKNIYPKYQTLYRYRSNCWLNISCQQNRSRKKSLLDKFEVNQMRIQYSKPQALEFRTPPLFPHLVPPAIMVWIFVWKYIFEPFIHILQHFVLQISRSTNFCFHVQLPYYLYIHKGKKQSSKYEEGILASTRYFTITRQF